MAAQLPDSGDREYTLTDESSFGAAICVETGERTELGAVNVAALGLSSEEGKAFGNDLFGGRVVIGGRLEVKDGKRVLTVTRIVRRLP